MNLPSAVIFTGLAAICRLVAAAPESSPPPAAQPPAKDITTLVRELSNESFRVRENASRDLWKFGETALPALTEASGSPDPELAYRARELLRKIQLHITPDTDPSVIVLVERYLKGSPSEKAALLGRMKTKRAWRQMLKLYASERSADLREKLRDSVQGVAVIAARECLGKGDAQSAREFLEMAPADAAGFLALAEFHRSHGTLEAELKRAKTFKGRKSAFWQLALQRAAGNMAAARDAATEAGEPRIAATMAALAGDPLPWLAAYDDGGADPSPVVAAYVTTASKRWLGKKVREADLEPLIKALGVRRDNDRGSALNALFLLGEVDRVEATFAQSEPLSAFLYFQSLERIPEALKALGLDPEQPDYKAWVEKRIAKLTADDIEDQHGVTSHSEDLVALANFLERKGLHDELLAAYSGPLAALAEKDAGTFGDFIGNLIGDRKKDSGAPLLAKRIGVSWAGNDDARWDELVAIALGEESKAAEWWDWLVEMAPKETRAGRFDALLAIFGLGTDPSRLREKWLARAWQAVDEAPAGERNVLAARISSVSLLVGDVANSLRSWDLLTENARAEVSTDQRVSHLTGAERWNDAAAVILKQIAIFSEANQEPRADLHAYAAAALRKAGRADEAAVHDGWADRLALGDAGMAIRIGNGYTFGGDYQRAAEWWARAAREEDPDSGNNEFVYAMKLHADALLEQGRWQECAAVSEMIASIYASSDFRWTEPLPFMHQRLQADMARALANLKNDRAGSLAILEKSHRTSISDGSLADFFFPAVRRMGLIEKHDEWFDESWSLIEDVIRRYPESDNTRNTAAWFASRAVRKLDEAAKHLAKALSANPDQSAYLDTMAEIQFAKGNREKALEWSRLAINFAPGDDQLRRQHERFRADPLPK